MTDLFTSGRIADLIVALMMLEALVFVGYYRRTSRGVAPMDLLSNLLAGICLLLALRGAISNIWWGWVALFLSAALLAHLTDVRRRWQS